MKCFNAYLKEVLVEGDADKIRAHRQLLIEHLQLVTDQTKSKLQKRLHALPSDKISMALIPEISIEGIASKQIPTAVTSTPNGDCLYYSASILICGNEHLSSHLRALVSIDLLPMRNITARIPTKRKSKHSFVSRIRNKTKISLKHASKVIHQKMQQRKRPCLTKLYIIVV